jgi:hypothetical protein
VGLSVLIHGVLIGATTSTPTTRLPIPPVATMPKAKRQSTKDSPSSTARWCKWCKSFRKPHRFDKHTTACEQKLLARQSLRRLPHLPNPPEIAGSSVSDVQSLVTINSIHTHARSLSKFMLHCELRDHLRRCTTSMSLSYYKVTVTLIETI